jgi:endonuclease/exonuclease/phosphatase family metal-dependent hydrolase
VSAFAQIPEVGGTASSIPPYQDFAFHAMAGVPYRLWLCGIVAKSEYTNESVSVKFSDSVDAAGAPSFRIGTDGAAMFTLEDCAATTGLIQFPSTNTHTLRVRVRDDELSFDQIVLLPVAAIHAETISILIPPPASSSSQAEIASTLVGSSESGTRASVIGARASGIGTNLAPVFEPGEDGFRIGSLQGAMTAPATILFTASATGPERADTLTYTWDFGDGSLVQRYVQTAEASRQNAVHTYTRGGTYTPTVAVTDQAGNSTLLSGSVRVAPGRTLDPATTLKVVQLNAYKGRSSDTRSERSKIWLQSRWIAAANPDVVILQEVMGSRMAEQYVAELEQLLPRTTWTYFFRTDAGTESPSAQGIAILTRRTIQSTEVLAFTRCPDARVIQRAAIAATVSIHGQHIAVVSTHLSSFSSAADKACRSEQAQQLVAWAEGLGSARIIGGDMNADPREEAMAVHLLPFYTDTWDDTAHRTAYPDNAVAALRTRSERIDYLLTSPGAPLDLIAVQVPDTRDVTNDNPIPIEGQTRFAPHNHAPRASDHELLIATFAVR